MFFFGVERVFRGKKIREPILPNSNNQERKNMAIIAFGAFQFIVPKYNYRLGKMEFKESSLLI